MFTKILKYDFLFTWKVFLAMAGGIIALSIAARLTGLVANNDTTFYGVISTTVFVSIIIVVAVVAVIIASYMQVLLMYARNFFGKEGYLTFTLPVKRSRQYASKVIVSLVWFNFMLLTVPVVVFILSGITWEQFTDGVSSILNADFFLILLEINLIGAALISILFLTVTLANTVIANKKIHGIVAGIFAALYHFLFFYIFGLLKGRSFEWTQVTLEHEFGVATWHRNEAQIGWEYGRIPFEGWGGGYIDIFSIGFTALFAAVTIIATLYLLKKRVALR
ncbi:MAG: hypothetical protein FWE44_05280 [Defluviitaleaceae bacterium]|nr:hypothetical protein [Defluviitaleaceae bacterium]